MPGANGSPRCCTMPGCAAATASPWSCRTAANSSKSPGVASFPGSTTPRSTRTSLPTKSPTSSTTPTPRRCSSTRRWPSWPRTSATSTRPCTSTSLSGAACPAGESYEDALAAAGDAPPVVGRLGDALLVGHHGAAQGRSPAAAGRRQRLLGAGGAGDGADSPLRDEPGRACTSPPHRCITPPG